MTDEERAHVIVTARLLRAAASLSGLAVGLTIVAAFQVAIAAIVLGVAAIYVCFRVSLDASLFDDIAAGRLNTAQLDLALRLKGNRDWLDRSRGAKRLIVKAAITLIAQLAALVLSSVYG
jgi:hypothetical protein